MKLTVREALRGLLGLQLGIAALMLAGDFLPKLPRMFAPAPPAIDGPVHPGDQVRRYQPDLRNLPDVPMRPYEMPAGLPSRLELRALPEDPARVVLLGTIAPGDAGRMVEALQALDPAPETVLLNSPGGSVGDALELGEHLREAGLATRVGPGDVCFSACPYLLAAGTTREVDAEAAVGVHQHYFDANSYLPAFLAVSDIQRGQAQVMAYLDAMGVDVRVMEKAMQTPPEAIYILLPEELEQYGLVSPAEE